MKHFFMKISYIVLVLFGIIIGIFISNVGSIHKWISGNFGSVAEWFSGIATILVLAITIWRTESANKPRVMISVRQLLDVEKKEGSIKSSGSRHFEIYCINYSNRPLPIVFMGIYDADKWYDKLIPRRWRKERDEYVPDATQLFSVKDYQTIESMQQSQKINYPAWSLAQLASKLEDDDIKKFRVTYMDMYGNNYNSYIAISGKVAKEIMKKRAELLDRIKGETIKKKKTSNPQIDGNDNKE